MLKLLFANKKKIDKLGKKIKKGKLGSTELFLIVVGMYAIGKIVISHEVEINNLKGMIGELKSKGE